MDFQKQLLNVWKALRRDEIKALAFLCTDLLGRSHTSLEQDNYLFRLLADQDLLSAERPDLLFELLLTIQRHHLVRHLNLSAPTSITSNLISPYRKMLYSLSEDITDEDLENIKFLLYKELPRRTRDKKVSTLEVFLEMEQHDRLSENDLKLLEEVIQPVCPMLKGKINRFKETQVGPPAQETGQPPSMLYPLELHQVPQSLGSTASCETPALQSLAESSLSSSYTSADAIVDPGGNDLENSMGRLSTQESSSSFSEERMVASEVLPPGSKTSVKKTFALGQSPTTNTKDERLETYPMTGRKKGICLIINNDDFTGAQKPLKNRKGTMIDEACFSSVFAWLGFEIEIHRDRKKVEMIRVIQELSSRDHSQMDCLVCCVLSHGKEGGVYGVDGVSVELMELMNPFKGPNCRTLVGKPKLFFIQACQGTSEQEPVPIESDGPGSSFARRVAASIPEDADFLLGAATVPAFVSYREPKRGTWFIQSLCQNLLNMVPRSCDLLSILTKVNADVSQKTDFTGMRKQMPQPAYSLTRKVVFPIPTAPPPSVAI